ncbi:LCCL domain-containing protein [Lentinula edodes]|uniref:LCCL domain-containing protein n=1 Tax=Lentinula edodes TaxID=5353 RepID=A0A1Q3EFQ2_LENED|nr:LCCL domain-containing protein [Lentinula edodes]
MISLILDLGDEQVEFVPLIVGGGDVNRTYRGDTFICAAALQAGLISDNRGGCASLSLIGNFTNFLPLSAHGLTSIGFPTVFPLSSAAKSYSDILVPTFGTFLPVLFISYAFWRLAFRFTLPTFAKLPLESAIWYLATFWAGVLTNITTDKIPIDTLTSSSLKKQQGAIAALVIIVIIVAAIVINQIRIIRKTGWFPYYLGWDWISN